jgi:hypothetical protein
MGRLRGADFKTGDCHGSAFAYVIGEYGDLPFFVRAPVHLDSQSQGGTLGVYLRIEGRGVCLSSEVIDSLQPIGKALLTVLAASGDAAQTRECVFAYYIERGEGFCTIPMLCSNGGRANRSTTKLIRRGCLGSSQQDWSSFLHRWISRGTLHCAWSACSA